MPHPPAPVSFASPLEPFRIGVAGLGTVGAGLVDLVQKNGDLLMRRAGRGIEIVSVSGQNRKKDRGVDLSGYEWVDDPLAMAQDPRLDVVVELIGGSEGVARALVERCLENGKAVVTANKALLAHHGQALADLSVKTGAALAFEAAVAGSIPIVKVLREAFSANKVSSVCGILNGTCNYILTEMRETGRDFADVLQDAQDKGYAESDPSFDIDGIDAAHKLTLLSAIAFGVHPDFGRVHVQGIRHLSADDMDFAGKMGFRIKLLGTTRKINGRIAQSVTPCLVPADSPIGAVDGVYNAVFVESDCAGSSLLVGRGAGAAPTASAVAADLVDLARGIKMDVFGFPQTSLESAQWADAGEAVAKFYLRLNVADRSGVLADISRILHRHGVSIESMIQHARDLRGPVPLVMVFHETLQRDMEAAVKEIEGLESVDKPSCLMRIEML